MQPEAIFAVDHEGGGRISARGENAHQPPLDRVAQAIHRRGSAQQANGIAEVASFFRRLRQGLQRHQARLRPVLSLRQYPLFQAAFQQRPGVRLARAAQGVLVPRLQRHIKAEGVDLRPLQIEGQGIPRGGLKTRSLRAESLAQVDQGVAQVVQRLVLVALGPEGAGQPGAVHRAAMPQYQQRQQPLHRAGAQARQRLAVDEDAQRTEEADVERGHLGGRFRSNNRDPPALFAPDDDSPALLTTVLTTFAR